jgi:excisionase family DNA binding protein
VKRNHSGEVGAAEASRRLQIALDYTHRLLWAGKLAGKKIGKSWRIPVQAIEDRKTHLGR